MFEKWFASRLRNLRLQEGMTQNELAEIAGIGIATLERLERGKVAPRIDTCILIAHTFGLTLSKLLDGFEE